MKSLMKFLFPLLFFITLFVAVPKVSADMIISDCKWNEVKIETKEFIKDIGIPLGNFSCRKGSMLELIDKYKYSLGIPLLITIMLEAVVFIIRGYRERKKLLFVALVNSISLPVGFFLFRPNEFQTYIYSFLPMSFYNYPSIFFLFFAEFIVNPITMLIIIETMVIVFEYLFLIYVAKFENKKKTFITVIIANVVSLILGVIIFRALEVILYLIRIRL